MIIIHAVKGCAAKWAVDKESVGFARKVNLLSAGRGRDNDSMPTSSESTAIGGSDRGVRREYERFLERHRPLLLAHLEGKEPVWGRESEALEYVDSVLTEWLEHFDEVALPEADAVERTFWYALYQLEELAERPDARSDPYVQHMMECLTEVRELLRHNQPLPECRFIASRPDGA